MKNPESINILLNDYLIVDKAIKIIEWERAFF